MKRIMILCAVGALLAIGCSKSSNSATASGGSGGSGLDGTGVFTYNGSVTVLTNITAKDTAGAQTFTPSGGIPSDAKFIVLGIELVVNTGTAPYSGTSQAYFNLYADDDTTSTANSVNFFGHSAPIPTSGQLSQSHFLLLPTYMTGAGAYDFRGKPSLKFYQDNAATNLDANTYVSIQILGFIK